MEPFVNGLCFSTLVKSDFEIESARFQLFVFCGVETVELRGPMRAVHQSFL